MILAYNTEVSLLLPEQNFRPMFTCWVLYLVRMMSCHQISTKKRKLSQKKYICSDVVKPWMETVTSGRPYVYFYNVYFYSALAHLIQNWLSHNVDVFWSKKWSPNRTVLNPLDYCTYAACKSQVGIPL